MLIVCPACASEYRLDATRIGSKGRAVRCASCRETWFVEPERGQPAAEHEAADLVGPTEDEAERPAAQTVPVPEEPAPASAAAMEPISVQASVARVHPPQARSSTFKVEPALSRLKKADFLKRHALAVVAGLWVGISLGAFAGRTTIVGAFPQTGAVYEAIGLPVNLRGLDLRAVKAEVVRAEGGTFLVVEGEIANAKAREAAVPPLDISVRGDGGQALYHWTNDAPRQTLGPAETVRFRARLASPPTEGRQVLVRFASGDEGRELAGEGRGP